MIAGHLAISGQTWTLLRNPLSAKVINKFTRVAVFPCTEGLLPPWDYWPGSTSWPGRDSQTVWPSVGIPEAKQGTAQEKRGRKEKGSL